MYKEIKKQREKGTKSARRGKRGKKEKNEEKRNPKTLLPLNLNLGLYKPPICLLSLHLGFI